MRKLLVLVVLLSLLIPSAAFAVVNGRPPEPVCSEGMITVEEAEWVEEVPAVTHIEHRCRRFFGGWRRWRMGECPRHGCWFGCQERTIVDEPAIPGYWIDPVCEVPEPVGEQCGRCSNIEPFTYVEWYDRDGGCDGDWYNERMEYPNDERCGYIPPIPTPEPTPEPPPTPEPEVILPKPLFVMWLLTYNALYHSEMCMVVSETHPSIERQQILCGWVATNAPCAAYVYDDDTWACDKFGGWRLPLHSTDGSMDLMDVWNRHAAR